MHAHLGLGSNLGDPSAQLQRAIDAIAALPGTKVLALSPLYRNPALRLPGSVPQPDYLNAAAIIETELAPLALLDALQAIEAAQGRARNERWAARPVDLDILLCGEECIDLPQLVVPHPALRERRFVLQPLVDLAPSLTLPDGTRIADLLACCASAPMIPAGSLVLPCRAAHE